ncbi:hypothetical protein RCG23_14065 [Neobacillus sp. PS3-34]|uniref:hypothetical protein n=1 Tax=Neobacillus sp. PS3-34 TaxID=3070678 RepID=UPI0027DFD245|nr:hypothetical protein [Neobacillus sp. PS3-34]WML46766.1 hypothetical protein RCG23_14065 [Neobacillus sp. PS3-34]
MNTILDDFLELKEILNSFNGLEKNYNWLLTDLDWSYPENYLDYFEEYREFEESATALNNYWITGENLTKLAKNKDVYFIWGVFSAFEKNEKIDLNEIKVEPYADGNPNFWIDNPKIQHPKAVVELVLWDSSSILLLSKDNVLSNKFRNTFEGWKDLNEYNQK